MIDIIHVGGCGGVAFRVKDRPRAYDALRSAGVTLLDGTSPKPGDPIVCGSCNNRRSIKQYGSVRPLGLRPRGGFAE